MNRLSLALAVLVSLWPAAVVVEVATGAGFFAGHSTPDAALGLAQLEGRQSALAAEVGVGVANTSAPDVVSRAGRLRTDVDDWYRHDRRTPDGPAIAVAMRGLDDAAAALAAAPSPGRRLAFERARAAYYDAIAPQRLI